MIRRIKICSTNILRKIYTSKYFKQFPFKKESDICEQKDNIWKGIGLEQSHARDGSVRVAVRQYGLPTHGMAPSGLPCVNTAYPRTGWLRQGCRASIRLTHARDGSVRVAVRQYGLPTHGMAPSGLPCVNTAYPRTGCHLSVLRNDVGELDGLEDYLGGAAFVEDAKGVVIDHRHAGISPAPLLIDHQ